MNILQLHLFLYFPASPNDPQLPCINAKRVANPKLKNKGALPGAAEHTTPPAAPAQTEAAPPHGSRSGKKTASRSGNKNITFLNALQIEAFRFATVTTQSPTQFVMLN